MATETEILSEQIEYYRARSSEYDDWFYRRGRYYKGEEHKARWEREIAVVRAALEKMSPGGAILELACGTGIWTEVLASHATSLEVVDASPEVLEICSARVKHPAFKVACADIFDWRPERRYDLVFFSFWLSHVPPSRFAEFWRLVRRCLKPGSHAFFVDSAEHLGVPYTDHRFRHKDGWRVRRDLSDGREFDIVKIFYEPVELEHRLDTLGWESLISRTERFFVYGAAS